MLILSELEELLLDFEVNLNNQPLTYFEQDLEYSGLYGFGKRYWLPDDPPEEKKIGDNWKKRQRYVHRCKETAAWKRWIHEYLIALRGIILDIKKSQWKSKSAMWSL